MPTEDIIAPAGHSIVWRLVVRKCILERWPNLRPAPPRRKHWKALFMHYKYMSMPLNFSGEHQYLLRQNGGRSLCSNFRSEMFNQKDIAGYFVHLQSDDF